MAKEKDIRSEILKACPLLDAFLNYNDTDRADKIEQLIKSTSDNMKAARSEEFYAGALFASVDISIYQGLLQFAHSDIDKENNEEQPNLALRPALFLGLGFEIGSSTNDFGDIDLFVEEIAKRAIEGNLINSDGESEGSYLVKGMLVTGFTLAQSPPPSLEPFSATLGSLD